MSRSLSSSLLLALALTLIVIQGVLAYIKPGYYLIVSEDKHLLSIGAVIPTIPPADVPVSLLKWRSGTEIWEVKESEGGYTIRQPGGRQFTYGLVDRDGAVFVSTIQAPQVWAVNEADRNLYTIGTPYKDSLITQTDDKSLPVRLEPSNGSEVQRWQFLPVLENSRPLTSLYGKSRFNLQCAM
ncbi:MAG: hypothetical protein J3R72DRAFT_462936 [Linnemannia gamsii]|nr:MAG: hypothetical protein J3R72DRAFT_462936 [Linnemannia gamsii]